MVDLNIEVPAKTVKSGTETSEFKLAKAASLISYIGLAVGYLVMYTPQIMEAVTGAAGADSKWAKIVGGILMAASVAAKALVTLGYSNNRTVLKQEELKQKAQIEMAKSVGADTNPGE